LEVQLDLLLHVLDAGVVIQRDLGQAGDAREHPLAAAVLADLLRQLGEDLRLLRTWPHDVHVALEVVEPLWSFAQAGFPASASDHRDPGVVLAGPHLAGRADLGAHRTELVDREDAPTAIALATMVGYRGAASRRAT